MTVGTLVAIVSWFMMFTPAIGTAVPLEADGDAVDRIVATPVANNVLLVAGADGLYERAESGWSNIAPAPPPGHLVSSGDASGTLLAGDHDACFRGGAAADLQRSDDGGATWQPVAGAAGFRPLAIWSEPNLALASTCNGLFQSLDDGVTWAPVEGIELGWEVTAFATVPQADGSGPVVLLGLTGEGGTSYLRSVDFSDPAAPVASADLRTYFALGGLAGQDDTFILAAIDGVWISSDAGESWEHSVTGLEEVVLEDDPSEAGFPTDLDPSAYGLSAVAILPGAQSGVVTGGVDGLYVWYDGDGSWTQVDGTDGPVLDLAVNGDGSTILYATDDGVLEIDVAALD